MTDRRHTNSHSHGHGNAGQTEGDHGHAMDYAHDHGDPNAWLDSAVLDAQICTPPVLAQFLASVGELQPRHVIDLGCGPGVGVLALAAQFPEAAVSGLDINQPALDAAAERAEAAGLAGRTRFASIDFDSDFTGAADPADLVWASMSLHHTLDPSMALGHAVAMVAPGGRIALAEFGPPVTMWPESTDVVADRTWQRWQNAYDEGLAEHLGEASFAVDWFALLSEHGMNDVEKIECAIRFAAPLAERERGWLETHITRGLGFTEGRLDDEARLAIEAMTDRDNPNGIAHSTQVFVDYGRTVFTGVKR